MITQIQHKQNNRKTTMVSNAHYWICSKGANANMKIRIRTYCGHWQRRAAAESRCCGRADAGVQCGTSARAKSYAEASTAIVRGSRAWYAKVQSRILLCLRFCEQVFFFFFFVRDFYGVPRREKNRSSNEISALRPRKHTTIKKYCIDFIDVQNARFYSI
jgi:hypothetical protein